MSTLLMRQASSFLQEKYKVARLALTDVSEIEMVMERVTDDNPWCPDPKSMTQIAEASYDFDDYWKIVDFLHKRFIYVNWKKWRQYYNSLILLEFLIIHGPEDFAVEFRSDIEVIKELGTFRHVDKTGVNWGLYMKNKPTRILKLMQGGPSLQEVRSKAIKLTNEIQGFGSSSTWSPSSPSSSSATSPASSWRSSFDSYSTLSPTWQDTTDQTNKISELKQPLNQDLFRTSSSPKEVLQHRMSRNFLDDGVTSSDVVDGSSIQETFTEINLHDGYENKDKKKAGFFQGIYTKHFGYSPLNNDGIQKNLMSRSLSVDVGVRKMKMIDHHHC